MSNRALCVRLRSFLQQCIHSLVNTHAEPMAMEMSSMNLFRFTSCDKLRAGSLAPLLVGSTSTVVGSVLAPWLVDQPARAALAIGLRALHPPEHLPGIFTEHRVFHDRETAQYA